MVIKQENVNDVKENQKTIVCTWTKWTSHIPYLKSSLGH